MLLLLLLTELKVGCDYSSLTHADFFLLRWRLVCRGSVGP